MFKLEIYSARTLNSIPPFQGPLRRAERSGAAPDSTHTCERTSNLGTISGRVPMGSPARGSN